MRRLMVSFLAAGSVVLLSACGQGGSAFNAGNNVKVDHVQLETFGNPPGVFKVVPGGFITVSAIGLRGSQNVQVTGDLNYTFDASISPGGQLFDNTISGQQTACGAFTGSTGTPVVPAANLVVSATSPNTVVLVAPTIAAANALFSVPAPAAPASYCILLNAHHVIDGVTGSTVIDVSNNA
ncbi:MAG TPA: hypothetical protein VKJ77_09440, partial [Caballeronia sp.]|nr:hypothetical protein [Caballeronia sp.]